MIDNEYFNNGNWCDIARAARDLRAYINDVERMPISKFGITKEMDDIRMGQFPELNEIKDDPEKIKARTIEKLYSIMNKIDNIADIFRFIEEMSYYKYTPATFLYEAEKYEEREKQ